MYSNKYQLFFIKMLLVFLAMFLVSCNGGGGGAAQIPNDHNGGIPWGNLVKLKRIELTPKDAKISIGYSLIYKATGYFDDNESRDITKYITSWTTSNGTVAGILHGKAKGNNPGKTTISANFNGLSGSASLTVVGDYIPKLQKIEVEPSDLTVVLGESTNQIYAAKGYYDNNTFKYLTSGVSWTSKDNSVATIGPDNGLTNFIGVGETTIKATVGEITGATTLTIKAAPSLQKIVITPDKYVIKVGEDLQYHATAYYDTKESEDITQNTAVVWKSSDLKVASIPKHGGKVHGESVGNNVTITANYDGVVGSAELNVISDGVSGVVVNTVTPLPYSVGLSDSNTVDFHVSNTGSEKYTLLPQLTLSPSNLGDAHYDIEQTTCGEVLEASAQCDYYVTYKSPEDSGQSGALVNLALTLKNSEGKTSTATFLAGGLEKYASPQVPYKVIVIYNSDKTHTIYPVIETSRHLQAEGGNIANPDYFMMAYFNPYPSTNQSPIFIRGVYRLYVGGSHGIKPGEYEIVSLPFFSTPQNNSYDQYIDWWNGVRIYMYDNPSAIVNHQGKNDQQIAINSSVQSIKCDGYMGNKLCANETIPVYHDKQNSSFSNSDPMQLVEYTIGGSTVPPDPTPYIWDETGVDFDMSYVDNLYLTATLERVNHLDPTEGWIGSQYQIGDLQKNIQNSEFMSTINPPQGIWPEYIYSKENFFVLNSSPAAGQIKVPSTHDAVTNIYSSFGEESNAANNLDFMLNRFVNGAWMNQNPKDPADWKFYSNILNSWQFAIQSGDGKTVWDAFVANYNLNCPGQAQLTLKHALQYLIGWVPVAICMDDKTPALSNPLPKPGKKGTPGQDVIDAYHRLMLTPGQTLNPWVDFIHNQLGMKTAYSFSIDDALGNVFTHGDGFVVNVGGVNGLENKNAKQPVNETLGIMTSGAPTNYFITEANICGLKVHGRVTKDSQGIPIIPTGGIPIYLNEVALGKSCKVVLDVTDKFNKNTPIKYKVSFILSGIDLHSSIAAIQSMVNQTCVQSPMPNQGQNNPLFCMAGNVGRINVNTTGENDSWFASISPPQ